MSSSNRPSKKPDRVKAPSAQRPNVTTKRPAALGTPFALSTKRWPSGPRPLSQVDFDEDEVLIDSFDPTLDGVKVRITAVLERTCVYLDEHGDRRLARKNDLWAEAGQVPVRRRGRP